MSAPRTGHSGESRRTPSQESYADSIRGIFPDDIVVAASDREIGLEEITEVTMAMVARVQKLHPDKPIDDIPEVFIEIDRGVLEDIHRDGVEVGLSHLRIAAMRLDSDGDLVLHITTVDRLDEA